jgi:dipeptidyl aminopeptidase/acylaminoacyl peptidase
VFIRDIETGQIELVSVGAKPSYGPSPLPTETAPQLTPDGRFVVFHITATNLVAGVTNTDAIYVRDLLFQTTIQASVDAVNAARSVFGPTSGVTANYSISDDGQYVAYEAASGTGFAGLVLRYDMFSGTTEIIHTNAAVSTPDSASVTMTPDGRFIAFLANTNGVVGEDNCVLVWDAQTGTTRLASGDMNDSVPAGSICAWPTITPDGRFVAFLASSVGLVTNDLTGDFDVYVRDLQLETTVLADADTNGVGVMLTSLPVPELSDDGRFAAFEAPDGSLIGNDHNRAYDLFIRDLMSATSDMVSAHDPALPCLTANGSSAISLFSASSDGHYLAFVSDADDLVPNDTNESQDVFVRDTVAGTNLLVSVALDGVSPGNGESTDSAISTNGRYVAFTSFADNLVPGDTNYAQDVFVRDLQAGTTILVSVNTNGTGPGKSDSYSPSISSDGRFVLFTSLATNLAPGLFTGENLFFRDLQAGATYALTTRGGSSGSMTPDGRYVAFLAAVPGSISPKLYVWDSLAGTRVYTNTVGAGTVCAISPDGQRVVYSTSSGLYAVNWALGTSLQVTTYLLASRPGLRFSADGQSLVYAGRTNSVTLPITNQVYAYDFQAGTNLLVSRSSNSLNLGNGSSDSPDISADGRFVAYRSAATDIVPGDTSDVPHIFLYDRLSGDTRLVTVSRFGGYAADNRSLTPVFTRDSQTLLFESWAADLVPGDFNNNSDILWLSLYSSNSVPQFSASVIPGNPGVWITWPAIPGKTYRVQFKSDMGDLNWQDVASGVTIVGSTGYLRDLGLTGTQRFYRVVAF